MAISLELAALIAALCEVRAPRRVADLGSGFSSAVLRLMSRDIGFETVSVDDSPEWLRRTEEFLARHELPNQKSCLHREFIAEVRSGSRFDLVLHDLGDLHLRADTLEWALAGLTAGGLAVLDDLHHPDYEWHASRVAHDAGMKLASVRRMTLDGFGRYGALVFPGVRPPGSHTTASPLASRVGASSDADRNIR